MSMMFLIAKPTKKLEEHTYWAKWTVNDDGLISENRGLISTGGAHNTGCILATGQSPLQDGLISLEIDVNIGNLAIATAILRLALGCVTMVTMDICFLVEAQSEEKLSKRLFGVVRICQIEMNSATFVDNAMLSRKVVL
ncbi:protein ENHANCED DISEASE RESISTANCE 2-like [Forsythia ovata]|uniref:Protein ENHANCED DISEASE RESISTANCE 2-like n=1 Tax=Forsythia ovata TaxID=205694 RepID=A0ABD1TQL3_9LAMI